LAVVLAHFAIANALHDGAGLSADVMLPQNVPLAFRFRLDHLGLPDCPDVTLSLTAGLLNL
jgi:hypothetical protein